MPASHLPLRPTHLARRGFAAGPDPAPARPRSRLPMKLLPWLGLMVMMAATGNPAWADTLILKSDASTLAAATALDTTLLDSGDTAGLNFVPVLEGGFGTFTPVPLGAPAGTEVINIVPGDGESGFFRIDFALPAGATAVTISGAVNADDIGRVFLNGTALTPHLNSAGQVTELGNVTFAAGDSTLFHAGTNTLLVADANTGGGPSGVAFFANVDFTAPVAEPGSAVLLAIGLAAIASMRRRHVMASDRD